MRLFLTAWQGFLLAALLVIGSGQQEPGLTKQSSAGSGAVAEKAARAPPAPPAPPRRSSKGRRLGLHQLTRKALVPPDGVPGERPLGREFYDREPGCSYSTGTGCSENVRKELDRLRSIPEHQRDEWLEELLTFDSESRQRIINAQRTRDVLELMYEDDHAEL
eukprot:TRINITY_DN60583_c0_g1_i2.p1 TRINITY_DN60583_c0_g1~~TRINITY_DN60583_c0_g1_i2.p1  ORF type:complete len:163 (+),score=25.30 TRINITY_DN60583_c0_g1_i2:36-524(+)